MTPEYKFPYELKKNIELIISPQCNLGCKYCYIHRHRETLFNPCLFNPETTISNLKLLLEWLKNNNLNPTFEIFSGELLAQDIGWQVLDTILEYERTVDQELRIPEIRIPTNFTFLCDENLTEKISTIIDDFNKLGIKLLLSASFDGKYMEENRPFVRQLDIPIDVKRDDEYYDKAFEFIEKTGSGIHPMIYGKNIDKWIQNFDWFQEKMAQHGIDWSAIYLLQVRNPEWSDDEIIELMNFIRHIYYYAWDKNEHDKRKMKYFFLNKRGFNILSEMSGVQSRGMGCSIQKSLQIRLSDFAVVPCHRLGYDDLILGYFKPDQQKGLKFEAKNPELMIAIQGYHRHCCPTCEHCDIRSLCMGQCLGAAQEANYNMFSTIPTVCKMIHATYIAIMQCLIETDCCEIYAETLHTPEQLQEFNKLREVVKNDYKN
jgi:radical SAM protein with 4Fe4S-binding SPASM domain